MPSRFFNDTVVQGTVLCIAFFMQNSLLKKGRQKNIIKPYFSGGFADGKDFGA